VEKNLVMGDKKDWVDAGAGWGVVMYATVRRKIWIQSAHDRML
jgi:hypothetical protein